MWERLGAAKGLVEGEVGGDGMVEEGNGWVKESLGEGMVG